MNDGRYRNHRLQPKNVGGHKNKVLRIACCAEAAIAEDCAGAAVSKRRNTKNDPIFTRRKIGSGPYGETNFRVLWVDWAM